MNRSAYPKSRGLTLASAIAAALLLLWIVIAARLQSERLALSSIIAAQAFLLSITFIPWLRSKRQAGAVLVDLGRSKHLMAWGITLSGLSALCGTWLLVLLAEIPMGAGRIGLVVFIAVLFSVSILSLSFGLSRTQIREEGVLYLHSFLKWERIESYEWTGKSGHILIVRPGQSWGWKARWRIPPVHKGAAEKWLAQYLAEDRDRLDRCDNPEGT